MTADEAGKEPEEMGEEGYHRARIVLIRDYEMNCLAAGQGFGE
jgi:hypothetical protein